MSQRARKTKDPCQVCFLHKDFCLCDDLPLIEVKTRLCLVVHAKELKRTTNTGRLAVKALKNSELFVRGDSEDHLDLTAVAENKSYATFLLYPSLDAMELTPELVKKTQKPIQLIVPDGNWRQASKVHTRHKELGAILRVKTQPSEKAQHFLRQESKEHGMATLQAIAEAFGVIEGENVKKQLLDLYDLKLKRTLLARGVKI